jgi:hypothetical protein
MNSETQNLNFLEVDGRFREINKKGGEYEYEYECKLKST